MNRENISSFGINTILQKKANGNVACLHGNDEAFLGGNSFLHCLLWVSAALDPLMIMRFNEHMSQGKGVHSRFRMREISGGLGNL